MHMQASVVAASIRVNGEDEPLAVATLEALLAAKAIVPDRRGVAIALNGSVVPRARWADTRLTAGDIVEIVLAKQGG
jgi:sulfur carrier protein